MARLFELKNKKIVPNDETLCIEPFKSIWERDKTKNKDRALKDFFYIEFMTSLLKTNPFKGFTEKKRHSVIATELGYTSRWKPDKLLVLGMKKMVEFQSNGSVTLSYLNSTMAAAEKLMDFFNSVNLNEVNPNNGTRIYKPKDITSALKDTKAIIEDIDSLVKKVEEELEDSKIKGGKEISVYSM